MNHVVAAPDRNQWPLVLRSFENGAVVVRSEMNTWKLQGTQPVRLPVGSGF